MDTTIADSFGYRFGFGLNLLAARLTGDDTGWMTAIISTAVVIAAAVVVTVVVRFALNRWVARKGAGDREISELIGAFLQPISATIGLFGLYLAALPLLSHTAESRVAQTIIVGWQFVIDLTFLLVILWSLWRMVEVFETILRKWSARTESKWDDYIVPLVVSVLRVILPITGVLVAMHIFDIPPEAKVFVDKIVGIVLIVGVAWMLSRTVLTFEKYFITNIDISVRDNLNARRIQTQVHVIKKIAMAAIVLFALASIMMLFEAARRFGTSIIASAGVAGIIVGFAAQKSIANVFAGIQIALTQPIRLDDVVVVEGEWGRIEEITLTYVVVKIWDQRRLVLPISYFNDSPFQNWTKNSAEIMGTVYLYTDYTIPVPVVRAEVERLCKDHPCWDGRVAGLQVTDSKENTLELRALVSAEDASKAWDLRCDVREALVAFIQKKFPGALPRHRLEHAKDGA